MTESAAPAEEQAQGQNLKSFIQVWTDHRKIVELSFPEKLFPKMTEEVKLQLSTAFFNAQIAVVNAQMLGQALGLPEKQQLVLALNEEREHRVKLERRLAQTEAAYHQLQKLAQERLKQ